MNRRKFASLSAMGAIALSTTGFIRFNGTSYEGDCETTTDILGPFYRPDSPVRDNLVIESEKGELVELKGIVYHKDCESPFIGAKVELWHCSADEVYDNHSDEYRYRGTTFCNEAGEYSFLTQLPVPYDAGGGNYRPAHFHMMISAPGFQSLVTQIYFTGDPYLDTDSSSASPGGRERILEVAKKGKKKVVTFDVTMQDKWLIAPTAMDKLIGDYQWEGGKGKLSFFRRGNQLWMKNEVYGRGLDYLGDNTFEYPGMPAGAGMIVRFDIQSDGSIMLTHTYLNEGKETVRTARKNA